MGKYIEFIGVSGVGKSTTYKFLKKTHQNNELWLPYEKLKYQKETTRGLKKSFLNFLPKYIRPNGIKSNRLDRSYINNAVKEHGELIELFWKTIPNIKDSGGEELKFYGVEYIQSILEKIQFIKENPTDKICLVDEGLLHNLGYFIPGLNGESSIDTVFKYMYLPKAVIYFTGDINVVVDRTIERGSLRLRDKYLTRSEIINSRSIALEEKNNCINAIKTMMIPVLLLDAMESIEVKSEKIKKFISTLE